MTRDLKYMNQRMKNVVRTIFLVVALFTGATEELRADDINAGNISINSVSNGTITTKSVAGRTVTITVTPNSGYFINRSDIKVQKLVDPSSATRTTAPEIADYLPVSGPDRVLGSDSKDFTFTIPDGYHGALIDATFRSQNDLVYLDGTNRITDLAKTYILKTDVGPDIVENLPEGDFVGELDGEYNGVYHKIIGLTKPLFASTKNATIKNVMFTDVNINITTSGTNVGAITGEAKGTTRIYNCGILSGSVSGTKYVGGLVGLLDGNSTDGYARVINCFSYASVGGGTDRAGIVGYNNQTSRSNGITTMVMNCMFYGTIESGGTNRSPVYGGTEIDNRADQNGLNTYNYYRYISLEENNKINKYNGALGVEEKYLVRFEFYRQLLNSNRPLAAWYVYEDVEQGKGVNNKMAKWVLDRSVAPYPILKPQETYPSVVNYDKEYTYNEAGEKVNRKSSNIKRSQGKDLGTLKVTISDPSGSGKPTGASLTKTYLELVRTDKDTLNYNFNYDKVQLPYYNEVGTGNYTYNKVVTGWKITSITGGTTGDFKEEDAWGGYNFADRNCTKKDDYNESGRVFSQGAYFDVPYGVTAITIEPYWGTAAYVADSWLDITYKSDYGDNSGNNKAVFQQYTSNGVDCLINGNTQKVYTSISTAVGKLSGSDVHDNAVVLVGNLHLNDTPSSGETPFTLMSADLDFDNEPDNSLIYHHSGRKSVSQIRFDFLNIPGTAMAQKPKNSGNTFRGMSIFKPNGWFEVTNTCNIYFIQFEYDNSKFENAPTKILSPVIFQGGIVDQFVSTKVGDPDHHTSYIHVGGNAYFKNFGNGTHSDGSNFTPHIPISVTGGDYDNFYLSGTYKPNATVKADDAECYISGGRFGELAGAAQQQIKGNVKWQIYDADIKNFYGGGVNADKPITGDITVNIFNSYVATYCGGPKFGNMAGVDTENDTSDDKTVRTTAEGCTFGRYFGAGYGGTSYLRQRYYDEASPNIGAQQSFYTGCRGKYYDGNTTTNKDGKEGPGVAADFDYEIFPWSDGRIGSRFYVKFASFSLAKTNDVHSNLKNCIVTGSYYGGGHLGEVTGTAYSELEDCKVYGNVFGGGYSAEVPKVPVRRGGFATAPTFLQNAGIITQATLTGTDEYEWHYHTFPANGEDAINPTTWSSSSDNYIYTNIELTTLGQVKNTNLKIQGNTYVRGMVDGDVPEPDAGYADIDDTSLLLYGVHIGGTLDGGVYGGGDASAVEQNTVVEINNAKTSENDAQKSINNVYGGGNTADVLGNTSVTLNGGSVKDVYGGGRGQTTVVGGTVTVNIGTKTGTTLSGTGTVTGDVYGGSALGNVNATKGSGWTSADLKITGNYNATNVNLYKGTINGSLYGGGLGQQEVKSGQTITQSGIAANVYGPVTVTVEDGTAANVFGCNNLNGAPQQDVIVNIAGGTITNDVYGGGNQADAPGNITVNVTGGTVNQDVYGGGALANTNTGNWDATANSNAGGWSDANQKSAKYTTTVRLTGGSVRDVYGGGLGDVNVAALVYGDVLVDLNGTTTYDTNGNVLTSPIETKGCIVNRVFGCNNVNGTPKGEVLVHVHATQSSAEGKTTVSAKSDKNSNTYDVDAVYGGGNQAEYNPVNAMSDNEATKASAHTNVIIDGCTQTSIKNVYGGGNAASTPSTSVTVNGAYEIYEVFGGGNGFGDGNPGANVGFHDYSSVESTYPTKAQRQQDAFINTYVYGSGKASVNIFGGTVHRVFGGSNTKGNVRVTAITMLEDQNGCDFHMDEAYGGGKSAPMDAEAKLHMACIPGLRAAYGGAEAADVLGDVTLNITNGTFDRVFGGNNLSGTISGSITVNIEETGCKPIIIGELYGGGNEAAYSVFGYKKSGTTHVVRTSMNDDTAYYTPSTTYSDDQLFADPQVNVKSFTSIGKIYGGGLGTTATMVGNPTVNVSVANGNFYNNDNAVVADGYKTDGNYPVPSHAKGRIGAINNVYGGGNAADVVGNTNVNIGTDEYVFVTKEFAVGSSVENYYIRTGAGTAASPYAYTSASGTAAENTTYYERIGVVGVDIRGNVYGGGEGSTTTVTGNVAVNIGGQKTEGTTTTFIGGNIAIGGSVYGGSALGAVNATRGTGSTLSHTNGATTAVTLKKGNVSRYVFGGGQGDGTTTAHVYGKSTVTLYGDVVAGGLYGGCDANGEMHDGTQLDLFGGTVGQSSAPTADILFGGGLGQATKVDGDVTVNVGSKDYTGNTSVTIWGNVYGGGALGSVNTNTNNTTLVNLFKGTVNGNVFGGGLGQAAKAAVGTEGQPGYEPAVSEVAAAVKGNVRVDLNGFNGININDDTAFGSCIVTGNIFGCNNTKGSPEGDAEVHIYKTIGTNPNVRSTVRNNTTYDLAAVYGGGNKATYSASNKTAKVYIETCDVSINEVYGGGFGADVPNTYVEVNGAYEIGTVFGGGYGAGSDDPTAANYNPGANVNGSTEVLLKGGVIHEVYGGSNTKGNIVVGSNVNISDGSGCCELKVDNIYGGGKNANMTGGANIILGCQPDTWIEDIYAGSREADVDGDVSLTITSGKFKRVFGGNKTSGKLKGSITVNIEETGNCGTPIIIGELYAGGNEADYSVYGYYQDAQDGNKWKGRTKAQYDTWFASLSASDKAKSENQIKDDPQLNVRAFTSIGAIYGGGYSAKMCGNPHVDINVVKGSHYNDNALVAGFTPALAGITPSTTLPYPAHAKGAIGAIGNVFGGGNLATVYGNTTVNIGTESKVTFITEPAHLGTNGTGEQTLETSGVAYIQRADGLYEAKAEGANITGNVYGSGNQANVTGDTQVNICAKKSGTTYTSVTSGTAGVTIAGGVFGAGKGVDTDPTAALVESNSFIVMGNGSVKKSIYGGGELSQVAGNTNITVMNGTIGTPKEGTTVYGGATYGNVYGGGFGATTNKLFGLIKGNTNVTISNGTILHNIYGGGAYGSVGEFTYDDGTTTNTGMPTGYTSGGTANVTITGGTIGTSGQENGMVFGSSRGDVDKLGTDGIDPNDRLAWVYDTHVTIGTENAETGPQIKGSLYGSGENGHTWNDTQVIVHSGTIGIETGETITDDKGTADTSDDVPYSGAAYPYRGNVYGGGCGTDMYDTNNDNKGDTYNPLAGIVRGNAAVTITGGTVVRNVYGAGAMGSVGKTNTDGTINGGQTTINISGGIIGVDGTAGEGNVFGAARGALDAPGNDLALVAGKTSVSVTGGTMFGNVYGGGELGYVGKFTSETNTETGSKTYTWPNNTGHCEVIVNGGSAVVKGHVFGAGKGTAETYECEPAMVYSTSVNIGNGTVNGKVYGGGHLGRVDNNTEVTIGTAGDTEGTNKPDIKGDVFGAGAGVATHGYSALVRGNSTVTVQGKANVGGSVYGGGETASVGKFKVVNSLPKEPLSGGTCTVTINGGAAISGSVYGACKGVEPDYAHNGGHWMNDNENPHVFANEAEYLAFLPTLALTSNTNVTIGGNAIVNGSVFGGGQRGITLGSVDVNMNGGTVNQDVYGGGALADTNTGNATNYGTDTESLTSTSTYKTTVNLYGGMIKGDAYGGGLGQLGTNPIPAMVYGDVFVNQGDNNDESKITAYTISYLNTNDLQKDANGNPIEGQYVKVVNSGRIFGCNNLNGSPKGNVTVTVNGTKTAKDGEGNPIYRTEVVRDNTTHEVTSVPTDHTYEVAAVYGGGNLAEYKPASGNVKVIIDNCNVSVEEVYGGGNAAKVPSTNVLVNGAHEIEHVFGGGNGEDKYTLDGGITWEENPGADIGGDANTLITGGLVHEAYGGSNEKGTIDGNITIDTGTGGCAGCPPKVDKLVGAGKNADVNGNLIMVLGCYPSTKTPLIFAGADNANVNGNVELTITSGTFGQVFGGNNVGGAIKGHIKLNIEETGCNPIVIDELYLGGNNAAYSRYGYYLAKDENNQQLYRDAEKTKPLLRPRESATDERKPVKNDDTEYTNISDLSVYQQPELNVTSCTRIDKVFGGGYGVGGTMYADPTVNINMIPGEKKEGVSAVMTTLGLTPSDNPDKLGIIGDVYGGGNAADVIGNPTVNIGTESTVDLHLSYDKTTGEYSLDTGKEVKGAFIKGNVFGAGMGKDDTFTCEKAMVGKDGDGLTNPFGGPTINIHKGLVLGNVYGGGEIGRVEKNTAVTIGKEGDETSAPEIRGYVFGGGKGLETHGYSALVRGNPSVTIQGSAKIGKSVYGGGEIASVGNFFVKGIAYPAELHAPAAPDGFPNGMPYALKVENSGKCTVIVRDKAEIGPDNMKMEKRDAQNNLLRPDDLGHVFGAGKGILPYEDTDEPKRMDQNSAWESYASNESGYITYIETLGMTASTKVTIGGEAFVKGSVYGGSENGHVLHDTEVNIEDKCQIGNGDGVNKRYTESEWSYDGSTEAKSLKECASWPYKAPYTPYDVYDYVDPNATNPVPKAASDGHTYYGNVFGGGSGIFPYKKKTGWQKDDTKSAEVGQPVDANGYSDGEWLRSAGAVFGNTKVNITGGHILTSVYGGNECTDVGKYLNNSLTPEAGTGTCTVNMTGGTVGVPRTLEQIKAHPLTCYVFGAGKGDQRINFNTWTNVASTQVNISGTARIFGSTFGGGEDGHVLGDAETNISGNAVIGTTGTSYVDGNVFGGGRGFSGDAQTAGTVGGNVKLDISGGTMLGSVYGGGRLASVGTIFEFPTLDNGDPNPQYGQFREDDGNGTYGHITINITGGTIGNEKATGDGAKYSGNVFGGSMGRLELLNGTRSEIWPLMAQVKSTEVNVSGDNTTIWRNVYGGGELGTVRDDAKVTVSGGTIRRDVYGGGYGSEDKDHTILTVQELKEGATNPNEPTSYESHTYAYTPMQFAGCVGKSTTVNVSGGYIRKSVYGGGEMASVGVIDYRAKETTSEPAADKVKIGPIGGKTYYYENIVKHGDETKEFALSWPYEFSYVSGYEGATHVNITGGRLGLKGSDEDATLTDNGDVYGAGKGLAGDYKDYLFCANVGSTDVKIAYTTTPDTYSDTGDCIAGAVYGGGEDGHVMGDTKLTISGGLINHSVYGAGSGKGKFKATLKKIGKEENYEANIYSITAGKVFGNSTVEMSGGYVVRNVYGGGNMGSVGKGNYAGGADDYSTDGYGEKLEGNLWDGVSDNSKAFLNSGKCTVKITGGTIGYIDSSDPSNSMYPWNTTASLPYGNVFGGCRGESTPNISETPRYLYSPEFFVGYANETEVTIEGDNTKILGSVYGGGMDGHVRRDAHVIINGGEIGLPYTDANKTLLKTEDINNIQWLARGNVYGSGSGIGTYKYDFDYDGKYTSTVTYGGSPTKEEDFSTSAGSVTRFTKVEIKGGNIYRNVYGGGSLSSIGAPNMGQTYHLYSKDDAGHSTEVGKQSLNEVIISGGQIGEATGVAVNYGGHAFGGSRGDASLDNSLFSTSMFTKVNIGGGKVLGSVFGGGEVGIVKGSVAVNVTGGEVAKDVYGGGALANTNTANWNPTGGTDGKGAWADGQVTDGKTTYTTTVNLLGGTVDDVFGGALGQRVGDVTGGTQDIEAFVYGDVNVNLNGLEASDYVAIHNSFVTPLDKDANNVTTSYRANDGCIVKGEVYGCNNINGTPKGHSKVHVFKTMARPDQAATADKTADGYDVAKIFGGGNNADYVPVDTKLATEVIIEGCDLTSIHQVYGGGNAAATPGTSVLVKGTKIIYEVFGGGNGEAEGTKAHVGKKTADDSDYVLGEGKAEVKLMAGNVTYVYGGSNTHGDIRGGSYVTNVTKDSSLGCCEKLNVKEIFAGGKNADMIGGAKIVMGCTNSEDWVEEIYAGAKAANVGGDVSLTLTSGKFGRVFGGNKDSGVLDGSITVNIEENAKCGIPLIIGELYGGGNKAAYSIYGYNADGTVKTSGENPKASPVVNVRAFTSIGNIFGGGYGSAAEMHGSPTININVVNNNRTTGSTISTAITKTFEEGTENEYTVTIPTHEDRKIGAINNVYGGGNAAKVWGDTNVNIGTEAKQKLVKLDDSGNPLYTDAEKTIPQTEEMDVVGADIRGNVYGGGNAAEVTGNTNVVIGKDGTTTTTP